MIQVRNATKTIDGREILSKINYQFQDGKTVWLTGHNGCGKTMLLRMLCGLIMPSEGAVLCDRALRYGVMIETPSFFENETAFYNLKYLAGIQKRIGKAEIEKALQEFNLLEFKSIKVKRFSLGMKQRLGICQAVMENPDVLLLDEPFNAVDEENVRLVYDVLNKCRAAGKTIVIASHGQIDTKRLIVDERIQMSSGSLIC